MVLEMVGGRDEEPGTSFAMSASNGVWISRLFIETTPTARNIDMRSGWRISAHDEGACTRSRTRPG